ncbi:MAG: MoaD/ThiS family protein [Candidatus Thorarchaeota archaeon]|nr:MoaD/ThiS family protein [Candidatus Thorarchaeota archaeon]
MIEIHLYGRLRTLVSGSSASDDTVLSLEYIENETFSQLISRLELTPKDLGDCFINGTLAKKDSVLTNGDRIGLFPFNMVLLCGGQHLKGHGYTREDIDVDYY